jgi:hypothetical protein
MQTENVVKIVVEEWCAQELVRFDFLYDKVENLYSEPRFSSENLSSIFFL